MTKHCPQQTLQACI